MSNDEEYCINRLILGKQTNLNQLLSDLGNQMITFPEGKIPAYTGNGGENSFICFINGIGPEADPYRISAQKNSDCYRGYIDKDGKAYLYDNSAFLQELGISAVNKKNLSLQEIIEL